MILSEFSKYIQNQNKEIINGKKTSTKILCEWIRIVLSKTPKNNVEKIIHKEIILAENKSEDYIIVGKSESGRILVNALYNYSQSYEQYILSKWLSDKQPKDFKKDL